MITGTFYYIPLVLLLLHLLGTVVPRDPLECGRRKVATNELLVNAANSSPGEWPWHAAIYHRTSVTTDSYACGGSLISDQFVLTAAHCVIDSASRNQLGPNRIFIRLGIFDRADPNLRTMQQHSIGKIYKMADFSRNKDDIALLEMKTVAEFNDHVQPICVEAWAVGGYGTVVGWGLTENDELSVVLRKAQMPVISTLSCLRSNRALFGQSLDVGMFCAGYRNGTSVCNGDSGGGMAFSRSGVWFLGGIVSFSQMRGAGDNRCQIDGYGVFTNVSSYLDWIRDTTGLQLRSATRGNLLPRECGINYSNENHRNGREANLLEFPWMAMIFKKEEANDPGKKPNRLGTLINSRYVMTSVWFWHNEDPQIVRLGEYSMKQSEDCTTTDEGKLCAPPTKDYDVERFIRHPSVAIVLLRTASEVQFEEHIQPICLPVTSALKRFQPKRFSVTAWGVQGEFDRLSAITLTDADIRRDCSEEDMICTSRPYCTELHGHPLSAMASYNGWRFVQFGMASYLPNCNTRVRDASNIFDTYINVSSHMEWIAAALEP
ncbi:polyserase-2-like [Topomyia yanbarensis]|uniref:polyserase-2-like n=1 Tax=Topomyia yanbarensis TaxID=2498891 RepID=UPI00273A85C2|nr:polyserase-2-like [Topomyia yanbarensis]